MGRGSVPWRRWAVESAHEQRTLGPAEARNLCLFGTPSWAEGKSCDGNSIGHLKPFLAAAAAEDVRLDGSGLLRGGVGVEEAAWGG